MPLKHRLVRRAKLEKSMQAAAVVFTLWQLERPENQKRVNNYWKWLIGKSDKSED